MIKSDIQDGVARITLNQPDGQRARSRTGRGADRRY